jgi:gamma-glutamyltranspeptidase/glutathione hydrolase
LANEVSALLRVVAMGLVSLLASVHGRCAAASATNGMVATGHPLATEAAVQALNKGGNAVDAAVAAALTLGVVDGHNSGIGGGCFMLIRLPRGGIVLIDGRETAPAGAKPDMFVRNGQADPQLSQVGALSVAVPGALATYDHALRLHGKLPLKEHLLSAAKIAENGFHLDGTYARRLAATSEDLKKFPASRAIFLKPDGSPFKQGELLKQPDLAASYRSIAEHGLDWFYKGAFSEATERWMKQNSGLLERADFRAYQSKTRLPIYTRYRGHQIIGFPPPSSGGVHVAQILNVLESFDIRSMQTNLAEFVHVVAEAMKLAFADRAHWLGDPAFASVPRGLISKEYAQPLAKRIQLDRAVPVPQHSQPPRFQEDIFSKHTTHFSAADREGRWVACTATINTSFGSKIVVPGTGVLLNNQMDDFAAQPGAPNYFGLIGSEANAIAPGKRPLSSMSPTIALFDGRPILCVGAAGGPSIISQTLLMVLYTVDFRMPLEKALSQPRFHHQWVPDELRIEKQFGPEVIRELEKRGHKVVAVDSIGATQAVGYDKETQSLVGAADPRGEGSAAGF